MNLSKYVMIGLMITVAGLTAVPDVTASPCAENGITQVGVDCDGCTGWSQTDGRPCIGISPDGVGWCGAATISEYACIIIS